MAFDTSDATPRNIELLRHVNLIPDVDFFRE
jgi:hypothetical protein